MRGDEGSSEWGNLKWEGERGSIPWEEGEKGGEKEWVMKRECAVFE